MRPEFDWELPHIREAHQLSGDFAKGLTKDLWAVSFYPFNKPGVDPIFAIVGYRRILICRPAQTEGKTMEVIRSIADQDENVQHFTAAWTKDLQSGAPLLCVSGDDAKIKVINVLSGEVERTYVGHGGGILDLQISPMNCQILASASEDLTIRIWSLDAAHLKQPCAAILAGGSHSGHINTIAFHASGRYLLSGATDCVVNLWTIPELPDENTGTNKTTQIHYPHFSSAEIHTDAVDCIAFHGDLILSRCANEETIVLWLITGFSSSNPPPDPSTAPTGPQFHDPKRTTQTAFHPPGSSTTRPKHIRLCQFSVPTSTTFTMRFALFPGIPQGEDPTNEHNTHPILAMCNGRSSIFFWDLKRIEEYIEYISALKASEESQPADAGDDLFLGNPTSSKDQVETPTKPSFLGYWGPRNRGGGIFAKYSGKHSQTHRREASPTESTVTSGSNSNPNSNPPSDPIPRSVPSPSKPVITAERLEKSKELWAERYDAGKWFERLKAHKEETVQDLDFLGRQVAWSPGGEWCVVVGSMNCVAVLQRWSGGKGRGRGRGKG